MPCMVDTEKEVSSKLYAKPGVGNVFFPVCQVVKFNVKIYVCVPMSSLRFHLRFPYFSFKIRMFSKKKGLHFDFISDFPIFLPKSGCSLKKKKRSSLRFHHDAACRIKSSRVPGVADSCANH